MFGYLKARGEAKRARARYHMAVLEGLMAENERRRAELRAMEKCRWCEAMESPEQREVCEDEFATIPGASEQGGRQTQ